RDLCKGRRRDRRLDAGRLGGGGGSDRHAAGGRDPRARVCGRAPPCDDTTVPVLAKEKTRIARLWAYVRDDRPFAGRAPPAAAFFYSPDRGGAHPERHLASFAGLMQADAYAGFNRLYAPHREPGPILEAACWAHARRKFFELAQVAKAPIAAEAVTRIDRLFAIERAINGQSAEARLTRRREQSAPILAELESWLRAQRDCTSR